MFNIYKLIFGKKIDIFFEVPNTTYLRWSIKARGYRQKHSKYLSACVYWVIESMINPSEWKKIEYIRHTLNQYSNCTDEDIKIFRQAYLTDNIIGHNINCKNNIYYFTLNFKKMKKYWGSARKQESKKEDEFKKLDTKTLQKVVTKMEEIAPPSFLSTQSPRYDNALLELAMRERKENV